MKDTIKAKVGYKVRCFRNGFGELRAITERGDNCLVFDGDKVLYAAQMVPVADYEYNKQNNECFCMCEVFSTIKGSQFIYWIDTETGEDFVTKIA